VAGPAARRRNRRQRPRQAPDEPGGILGAKRRGKLWRTTIADPAATRSPDLVNRDFTADRPRVANFSNVRCYEGMVFFSFVIDVYSRRIVGGSSPATCANGGEVAKTSSVNMGFLTFPWVSKRRFHRGSSGQSPASDSIASAFSAPGL
jgi:transposase InsO family protein